jgi:hypothetical protein
MNNMNNINQMAHSNTYSVEYDTKIDCDCDCKCEGGVCDLGKYRLRIFAKNMIEIIILGLFALELAFGAYYVNKDIYSNIYNISNGKICTIRQSESYTAIDAQKLLIASGVFGILMMSFKILHFNISFYYTEYLYAIKTFLVFHWIFYLLSTIFIVINFTFLFITCGYFDSMFYVYILSLIYNSVICSGLATLAITDYFSPDLHDLRALLMQQREPTQR